MTRKKTLKHLQKILIRKISPLRECVLSKVFQNLNFGSVKNSYMEILHDKSIYENRIHLLGFGFDGSACFRKGTRNGPDAFRDISYGIETFSPYLNLDIDDVEDSLVDLGNLHLKDQTEQSWHEATDYLIDVFGKVPLKEKNVKLITLGGEHSISYGPIKSYLDEYQDLVLIHLDAHADLRDGYEGFHYSHASIIRRALDNFKNGHELIQYGIRSGTKDEYEYMNSNGTLYTSRKEFLDKVNGLDSDRPIYLTLDLDYFDPSYFPGTGTPEPGGEDFHSFISLMKILLKKNFVGADLVELAPEIDTTGNSSVFAAKVLRETILAMKGRHNV